jgi:hypothetical protein
MSRKSRASIVSVVAVFAFLTALAVSGALAGPCSAPGCHAVSTDSLGESGPTDTGTGTPAVDGGNEWG